MNTEDITSVHPIRPFFSAYNLVQLGQRQVSISVTLNASASTLISTLIDQKIWIPIYAIHQNPSIYPKPDIFDSERFNGGGSYAEQAPMVYLPFGDGPKNCIGIMK